MSAKPVTVKVKGAIKDVLAQAKKEAAKKDVIVDGDEKKGKVRHKKNYIYGTYDVSGQSITVKNDG